eukprot:scaffold220514_cov19-Tisochrysis_lutea.AAC.1
MPGQSAPRKMLVAWDLAAWQASKRELTHSHSDVLFVLAMPCLHTGVGCSLGKHCPSEPSPDMSSAPSALAHVHKASVRDIQRNLEDTTYLLRIPQRKPFGSMAKDVSAALSHFTPEERPKLLDGVPEQDKPECLAPLVKRHQQPEHDILPVLLHKPLFSCIIPPRMHRLISPSEQGPPRATVLQRLPPLQPLQEPVIF